MYNNLLTKNEDGIFTITINREAKLNALNLETLSELRGVISSAAKDKTVRGIIITGAGPKAFVAGADIAEFANFTKDEGREMAVNGHSIFNLIENCSKPVIAAVNGFALGGGCELAMACHVRVATASAKFGQPEVNLGIIPGYGGTQRLLQLIGKGKGIELLMTADLIGAEEALRLGLINYMVSAEELIPKCQEILNKIKSKSPMAISKIIETVNVHYGKDIPGFDMEIEEFASCFNTEEFKEGTSAFMEKRAAKFN